MPINKMDEFLESHTANSLKRKQITSPTPTRIYLYLLFMYLQGFAPDLYINPPAQEWKGFLWPL